MTTIRQIDTKTQYALKRKEFRQHHYSAESSLKWSKPDSIQNNSIQKPLQGSVQSHISFKGFDFNIANKLLKPIIKPVPKKLTKKVFQSLGDISKSQFEYYSQIRKSYVDFIKLPIEDAKDAREVLKRKAAVAYRKKQGISDEMARNITEDTLLYLPKKRLVSNFVSQIVAPFKTVYKGALKVLYSKDSEKMQILAIQENMQKDFSSLEGLLKSHEIWENGYRKISGNPKWTENSKFLIPDDVLYSKLQRRRNKVVDPNKGKYSSSSLMLGNRFISGIIYSYFLGTDAYNTTMRYSDDRHEASSQRNSRVAQEFSRIGLNMYIQNLLFGTFETAVNRSLPTAMFVSGSTVAFSEILGRKLVGKPIMPSDKEKLDRLEKEMYEKKGVLSSIGRLLTNVKKKPTEAKVSPAVLSVSYTKTKPNEKVFNSFSKAPSFKGLISPQNAAKLQKRMERFFKIEHLFDKEKLAKIVKIVEEADPKTAESLKDSVMKSVAKSKYFEVMKLKKPETFEELVNSKVYEIAPIGTKKTIKGLLVSSIIVPLKFIKNLGVSVAKSVKKLYNSILGKKNDETAKKLGKLAKSTLEKDKALYVRFNEFYQSRMKLEAWAKSALSNEEKEIRIYKEFCSIAGKDSEDIQGAKNILLWLDKQIKKEKIEIKADGTFDEAAIEKVRNIIKDSVLRADSAKHVEYDGNTLAQTNINLARAITTLFLVTDAYNLTMQYSNDNRKDANKSAKNRAAQEVSRIGVSAYILAFVHNLLSKLCNSSLGGAFALTALTSSINDSISRKVVGVPLSSKSQEQLQEIDKKNAKSKSPIKKALAYSIGKKSAMPQSVVGKNKSNIDYFSNDFFVNPVIN